MDTNLLQIIAALANKPVVEPSNTLAIVTMILASIAPLIAAAAAYYAKSNQQETTKLKEHINSRMDELQKETKKASFAEGAASTSVPVVVPAVPVVLSAETIAQIVEAVRAADKAKPYSAPNSN